MKIRYATISKTGRRSNNEDYLDVIDMPEKGRWMGIVCDGMGGHANGEVASETVVKAITAYWNKFSDMHDRKEKIEKACRKASVAIDNRSFRLHHCQMGTTMVMASIENGKATIAHIGDSRCYMIRPDHHDRADTTYNDKDHVVYQTTDHVCTKHGWEFVEKCFFTYHPEIAVPDIAGFEMQPGDRIFLCSDGVYKCIAPDVLKARLMDNKSPEEILDAIDVLCQKDGDDNYTAIMAKIEE